VRDFHNKIKPVAIHFIKNYLFKLNLIINLKKGEITVKKSANRE